MTALAEAPAPELRVTFLREVRSEFIKLATLRSTWWSLGITVVLAVGIAVLVAAASRDFEGGFAAVTVIVSPMQFTGLVAGIFGAMAITGEYSTGMIRSSLTAVPARLSVLGAKAIAVASFLAATTLASSTVAVVLTAPFFGEQGIDWSEPAQSIVPLAYGVLVMVSFGLLGLGFGFVIRGGAGAIAVTVGVIFILPVVLSLFAIGGEAWAWVRHIADALPLQAAATLTAPGASEVGWPLVAVLAWPAAALVLGGLVLRSRDA